MSHWTKFMASAATVLTPHNWLWMVLAWLLLKIIHELSHALACKYHRGEVRDTGVIFILLAPMAYVDVTSCWRFPSRWQRIHVAAAGMVAELVVAAIAAITWVYVDSSIVHHLLFNVIVMASLSTLLFNANPLMRFDGYYILADLLKIPNLATDGSRSLKNLAARILFGEKRQPLQILGYRRWFVCGYGFAAAAWRLLICVSLVTAASVLLHGAGLLLAVVGVVSWFGMPLWKFGVDLQRRLHEKRPSFVRATVMGTALAAAFAAILLWVPWPGAMKAPVVVDYSDQSVVRSSAAGFVQRVHVVDGQSVEAGQLLVELYNDELEAQRRELEIAIEQGRVRHRVAVGQQHGAEAQIAVRNLQATEERLVEIFRQSEGLEVRAPVAGRIVARNLKQSLGTYVQDGAEILTVADEARKELVMSVGQEEIDAIMPYVGGRTPFRIGGRLARAGTLDRLDPRASTALPHPAMSASVGGSLAVTQQDDTSQTNMQLVEPRFRGVITLSPEVCRDLGAGEQGYAVLGLRQESIGEFAWVQFHRWFQSLLRPVKE
jgi:putative peptide zinc metalloprotease protein